MYFKLQHGYTTDTVFACIDFVRACTRIATCGTEDIH